MWDVEDFVSDFKSLINRYREEIAHKREDSLEWCVKCRNDSKKMLEVLLCAKVSKGYFRSKIGDELADKINGRWNIPFLNSEEGRKILLEALRLYQPHEKKQYDRLKEHLFHKLEDMDMEEWVQNEKLVERVLPTDKMRNVFLRDCKSFDYVPIDRHEKRFLMRTGIFFHYLSRKINNPNIEKHYEKALRKFAREFLTGVKVGEYDLGKSPGLVDKFIWLHCADKKEERYSGGKEICAKTPNCNNCVLSKSCLLSSKVKT